MLCQSWRPWIQVKFYIYMIVSLVLIVVLQLIPAHCDVGLPGNDEAVTVAKLGSRREQVETLATYSEMSMLIESLHKKINIQKYAYHHLNRKEQVIIFRLRTDHARLNNHMHNRFKIGESSEC